MERTSSKCALCAAVCLWLLLPLLSCSSTRPGADTACDGESSAASQASWVTRVIAVEPEDVDEPQVLWLGLVNETGHAQFVCMNVTLAQAWEEPHKKQSRITASSPHECRTELSYKLVAVGETLFVPFAVPEWEWFADQASLQARIDASFYAYPWHGSIVNVKEQKLTWEGSLKSALQAGTEIAASTPVPR